MQKTRRSYASAEHGFTLLELIIVCVLISISLALSLPTLRNAFTSDELAAGSRKVISLITSARGRAVRDGVPQLVSYEDSSRQLWYQPVKEEKEGEKEEDEKEEIEDVTPQRRSLVVLPEGVRIGEIQQASGGDDSRPLIDGLWISKQGYMDRTVIRLTDGANVSMYLIIKPFFFDVQVADEFPGFE